MRIALISTLRTSVPPRKTGSVELIVGLMANELERRGHQVTVFATGDSQVPGRLMSVLPTGYHHDRSIWDWHLAEFMQLGLVYQHAADFDLIHSHVYCYALPFTRLVSTPTLHTFHICPTADFVRFCGEYPEGHYAMISEFQRRLFGDLPVSGVITNGIDTGAFPFEERPGEYLAWLGDFRAEKSPLEAIHSARAAGVPIRLAGHENAYFRQVIQPEIDGSSVEYVGEVDHASKARLLSEARALLFPALGLEACPLVLLEAMACGTPVLGIGQGPVPELIGEVGGLCITGFDQLASGIDRLAAFDRRAIRRMAVERFDVSRMVSDYVALYERLATGDRRAGELGRASG